MRGTGRGVRGPARRCASAGSPGAPPPSRRPPPPRRPRVLDPEAQSRALRRGAGAQVPGARRGRSRAVPPRRPTTASCSTPPPALTVRSPLYPTPVRRARNDDTKRPGGRTLIAIAGAAAYRRPAGVGPWHEGVPTGSIVRPSRGEAPVSFLCPRWAGRRSGRERADHRETTAARPMPPRPCGAGAADALRCVPPRAQRGREANGDAAGPDRTGGIRSKEPASADRRTESVVGTTKY